jgi:hypothetical protein
VAELHGLRTVQEPEVSNRVVVAGVAGGVLVTIVALVASATNAVFVAVPLLVGLLIGFSVLAMRLRRRFFTLYAEYGGRTVQVFSAFDQRRYNQICRALLRAREYDMDRRF